MEKILINDLSFAYPDEPNRLIIKDINLEIEQGEFVCLLGQSGCGKSTLLKLLAGLQKPSHGEITIDGDPIKGASLEPYSSLSGLWIISMDDSRREYSACIAAEVSKATEKRVEKSGNGNVKTSRTR